MFNKKFSLAAMTVGTALALVPMTASARDRDDYRHNDRREERHESHERFDHDRGRGGFSFGFSIGAPVTRYNYASPVPATNGYYDQYGIWHAYGPAGYYDQNGYWHQQ